MDYQAILIRIDAMMLFGAVTWFSLGGCASVATLPELEASDFKSRANTRSEDHVRVSTSVLSAEESLAVYGVSLATKGIQPVWIEVENRDDITYWLLSPGLDPNFFPASEAADVFASEGKRGEIEHRFRELAFRNPVAAGAAVSGFVLTNLDKGVKITQVDLVASGKVKAFSFLNFVPGFPADYYTRRLSLSKLYPPEQITDYTDDRAFRSALEALPCCVTNKSGTRNGDPLNLIVVGDRNDAFPAFVRRGWHPTEQTWTGSVTKMMASVLSRERYPYAPVSPLYLYGRSQDLALQKARDNIHQRNHLRLWLSPMRYQSRSVWVGQISRDIGSRLTIHSPYLTTHKIDPDIDEARYALTEDMTYSQNLAVIGLVKGVGAAPKSAPRENLTTDPYYTDGFRLVLIFDERPTSLQEINFLHWEGPEGGFVDRSIQERSR